MPEHLIVDPFHLELAGAALQSQVLPEPPPPWTATGADAVSEAINVTMPVIEAPVTEGLPAAQAAITATGSKVAAAARRYAETDQKLGERLDQTQFTGNGDKAATPPKSAYSAVQAPVAGGGPQLSSAPPAAQEQFAHSTAPAASGPGTPDPGLAGGAAPVNPEAPDDALNPGPWAGPAGPEAGDGLDSGAWDAPADPDASDGAVKPASVDTSTDAGDAPTDQDASGDPQNAGDQAIPGGAGADEGPGADDGPATADGPGTANGPGTPDESEPGMQNGSGPGTADGSKPSGDPRTAPDPATQKDRPAATPPRSAGAGGRGLFSVSQAGAGAGGRGIPQSLAGTPKPPIAPLRPAAAHPAPAHHAPVAPPAAHDGPARPMPVGTPAAHTPLSPAAPAAPLSPTAPHGPAAPAVPQPPPAAAPDIGGGAPGPAAPATPTSMPSQPVAPGTSPVAADPASDSGSKPTSGSPATPPVPRTRDALLASIPVSPARAERDAVAEAATADAARRDGVDPLLLARRIAAALNVPGSDDDDEGDFGFFWVTAVTTDGAIVLANSYGIAYIPEGVRLPEPVTLASADDEIPVADRASWATYPVIAVQGWAQHHEYELRAVIATEEQLADSAPGVEKFVLRPDDIPDSGEMIGRSRLEVVDPRAAEWLAAVPDESLRDRLPPAPAAITPPADEEGMLWFEVMEPMFSTDTGREDAHLKAFHAYAAAAEQLALRAAHRRVDAETRRAAIADWLYWRHLTELCDTALGDAAYRRRTADLYGESAAVPD
ncbi:hypothetical protein SKC41_19830 [Mycobacterium sp. 050128]|uniref:hypothetical protein n=1 Tax=Mycobacterium sp. 050128 TaxID=3096112 RepID=UPI002EDAFC3F